MPWTSKHLKWLKKTKEIVKTVDGETVDVWELVPEEDDEILSVWAKHFRNHYCLDSEIDFLRKGYSFTRQEFLNNIKFPDPSIVPGPSIRAGDFGEILIADYLEYFLGFWVPRGRYDNKSVRNESTKGCDIIGFKIFDRKKRSSKDEMAVYEAKAKLTSGGHDRLQDAVNGSAKDYLKLAESLNAIKQRLSDKQQLEAAELIERFQNLEDHLFREKYGAAAILSEECYDRTAVEQTSTKEHPKRTSLSMIVIKGENLMKLVHMLYQRAADEA